MSRFDGSDSSLSELLMVMEMTGWESWGCSERRGERFRETLEHLRGYKRAGERLFTRDCSDWTRGNGLKVEGRFRIDFRKKFFIVRVMRHWA